MWVPGASACGSEGARETRREERYVHPHTFGDTGEPAKETAPAHLLLAQSEEFIFGHGRARGVRLRGRVLQGTLPDALVKGLASGARRSLGSRLCVRTALVDWGRRNRRVGSGGRITAS